MPTEADPGPLRVVHVVAVTGEGGQFGGPTTVAVGIARELARRRSQVTFVSLRSGTVRRPDDLDPAQWSTFPARRLVPRTGMLGLFNLRLAVHLWRVMGRGAVVHVHAGRDLVSLAALVLARLRRTPVVAQTHGMVLPRDSRIARLFDAVFVPLLADAHAVLYLTESEHEDLRSLLGPHARLRFMTNGVPTPGEPGPRVSPPRVVFAARLHPVKRVLTFAEAAGRLVEAGLDADFVVYGPDQGDLPRLLEVLRESRMAGRVRYGGALGHDETLAALDEASVFVLPSSADWMPMSLLEAMAAGVPSVCTTSCGLAPVIAEAGAGLIVDGEVDDVAVAIRGILEDPDLAHELSTRARALVRERFSVSAVVDDLETVYADASRLAATSETIRSTPS